MLNHSSCCHNEKSDNNTPWFASIDWLLWGSMAAVIISYCVYVLYGQIGTLNSQLETFTAAIYEYMNTIWIGIVAGIVMVSILTQIPREMVMSILGPGNTFKGILRAVFAGFLLDLCSHGILLVGAKLYERGASNGQLMAFLVTSPWNSFSLFIILWTLIGFKLVMIYLLVSMAIGLITGILFNQLTQSGTLPQNPNQFDLPEDYQLLPEFKKHMTSLPWDLPFIGKVAKEGISESRMVIRWILFSVVVVGLLRTFVDTAIFADYFGPSILGLGVTLFFATIIEVCSEGSVPIAADIVTRAGAPGNGLAFLMAGATTDYTEIMVIKDTTKSWKPALFLPLITVPQVILIAWLINQYGATAP